MIQIKCIKCCEWIDLYDAHNEEEDYGMAWQEITCKGCNTTFDISWVPKLVEQG